MCMAQNVLWNLFHIYIHTEKWCKTHFCFSTTGHGQKVWETLFSPINSPDYPWPRLCLIHLHLLRTYHKAWHRPLICSWWESQWWCHSENPLFTLQVSDYAYFWLWRAPYLETLLPGEGKVKAQIQSSPKGALRRQAQKQLQGVRFPVQRYALPLY